MGNYKENYLEGALALILLCSSYFAINTIKTSKYNKKVLSVTQSKLMLENLHEQENIEEEIETKKFNATIEQLKKKLILSGFEILKINIENNIISFIVKTNDEAKKNAQKKIQNISFSEINSEATKITIKKMIEQTSNLTLQGICFFEKNDWKVFINNKAYDNNNKQINENTYIINATQDFVKIMQNDKEIMLSI